jgi:Flp pilus assembly protein TadD
VYPVLIASYRRLGDEAAATALGPAFLRATTHALVVKHERTARQLLAEGRTAEAGLQLAAALKLEPRSVQTLTTLGYVRVVERRLDEAVWAVDQALAIDPGHAAAHRAMAQIARARGDEVAARRHLQAFVRLAPRTYEAWQMRETLTVR